ncbi:MAG: hypothetical protein ACI92Z_002702 [Paracoccaceae bacterium]|jgi:hypothetical protein
MSLIRPEAQVMLTRWREVLIGGGVILIGLYWITGPAGLLGWVGWPVAASGMALVVVGLQRVRFRRSGQGPGTVQVDEGQVIYFGPLSGGAVSLPELEQLIYDPTAKPAHWELQAKGQPPLHIPVNADGAEALFDVFATLPGLRTQRMLTTMRSGGDHPVVIWQRHSDRPLVPRLH